MKVIGSVIALAFFLAAGCSREEAIPVSDQGVNGRISYRIVRDKALIRKVMDWQKSHESPLSMVKDTWILDEPNFSYDELTLAEINGERGQVLVANQVGFDKNNPVSFGMAYFIDGGEIIGSLMVRLEKSSAESLQITYFSLEERAALSMDIDLKTQTSRATISEENNLEKGTAEINGWGKNTMACLADAYTNHGAISVWATVQTAFIPQTAAALAIACGIKNL